MKYQNIVRATFLRRPNRFISHCLVETPMGEVEVIAHVKNTGRCEELLIEGVTVYLEYAPSITRKTDYSLIAVMKGERLINMDSQVPNKIVLEGLLSGQIVLPEVDGEIISIKTEVKYGNSRFDLYVETAMSDKIFIEVKGVTLEEEGVAMFPDAPTIRGVKHVRELISAKDEGYKAFVIFIIQMSDVVYFTPNALRDPVLAEVLKQANEMGVEILAYDCHVTPTQITVDKAIKVLL